jgi:hypothetical protein
VPLLCFTTLHCTLLIHSPPPSSSCYPADSFNPKAVSQSVAAAESSSYQQRQGNPFGFVPIRAKSWAIFYRIWAFSSFILQVKLSSSAGSPDSWFGSHVLLPLRSGADRLHLPLPRSALTTPAPASSSMRWRRQS